jgi:hypothetical protein
MRSVTGILLTFLLVVVVLWIWNGPGAGAPEERTGIPVGGKLVKTDEQDGRNNSRGRFTQASGAIGLWK